MWIKLTKFKVILITVITLFGVVCFQQKNQQATSKLTSNVLASISTDNQSHRLKNVTSKPITAYTILSKGNGILFMETTDRMEPPSLVLCAIESAARVYPDRPVVFFMKGLGDIMTEEDEHRIRKHFPTLLHFDNIYFLPLKMEELFMYTPLITWYKKVNPKKEKYWTHVISDASRFAMMWKHGGIYMDTDVISIRPIPKDHFVAAESTRVTSSSVFGLPPFHSVTWEFMENFVVEYKGYKWGHQGPGVFTRVIKKLCGEIVFTFLVDTVCGDIFYFHPYRFYPILYTSWEKYFEVNENPPTFTDSYGLHLWNYKNKVGLTMVPGSNTLVEHLYKKYCPLTYGAILRNETIYI
ncbi:alpha-1,4-N-acetylglucosaminyltransferase-like [Rana temporaria]|uniref:alpha-1,4-N-acetylglucosaminyltransferase-like n=1 Tax=Rana temporaria TaxID=8407 RepID=UPI001AADDF5A|nr:alpha-1,4-N-acetylglucosaminyltransferase-like [Rana temporaria]XP_040204661.1 alpha-1,4-N-acetylglucosaminyltransferase-like [Rana temporaria]